MDSDSFVKDAKSDGTVCSVMVLTDVTIFVQVSVILIPSTFNVGALAELPCLNAILPREVASLTVPSTGPKYGVVGSVEGNAAEKYIKLFHHR